MRLPVAVMLVAFFAADATFAQRGTAPRSRTSRPSPTMTVGRRADGFTWTVTRGHVVRKRDTLNTAFGPLLADGWAVLPGRRLVTVQRVRLASGSLVPPGTDDLMIARWTSGLTRFPDARLTLDSAGIVGGKHGRILRFEVPGAVGDIRLVAHRGGLYFVYSAREAHDPLDPRTVAALDAFRLLD